MVEEDAMKWDGTSGELLDNPIIHPIVTRPKSDGEREVGDDAMEWDGYDA